MKKFMNKENINKGLRVIPLSGAETVGLNSYVIEYNDDIFIVDYGVTFPAGESYGVEYLLPPIDWLKQNKHRIKAIIVTHAHMDHIGGIPFVLDELGYPPVYGSPFSVEFLKEKLIEVKKDKNAKLHVTGKDDKLQFGAVTVSFFHVTHSIPQSYGVCFHTPQGRVVYTGDYKLDQRPINEQPTEMEKIRDLGEKGVLVALGDSTNAFEPGRSKSETEILETLMDVIKKAEGRVIIATFSSLVTRLGGVIEAAKKLNKKVLITGRSLESNIKIAMKIGYIHPQNGVIIQRKHLDTIPDNQLIILTTGSQGEPMASLTRIASNKHSFLTIKKTDTVIMSSSVIPNNVIEVQKLMDMIARRGARIVNTKLMNVHVSGHPNQEDMIAMAKALNPKYFIPVHGFTSFAAQHKRILVEAGFPESQVFVPVEGGIFSFKDGVLTQEKKLEVEEVRVIDRQLLSSKEQLIIDRKAMASEGICTVTVVDRKDRTPEFAVSLRGFAQMDQTQEIVKAIKSRLSQNISKVKDEKTVKKSIYTILGVFFHKKLQRYPVLSVEVAKS
ncbi:ribonuclease J [bacterium]|nr:ribonuclease J [bacterium]